MQSEENIAEAPARGTLRIPLQQYAFLEITAETPDDILSWVERATNLGLVEAVSALTQLAEGGVKATVVDTWESAAPAPQQAAPAAPQAAPSAHACAHGERVFKSGTSKAGKQYSAWFCPAPQGSQCSPQWK